MRTDILPEGLYLGITPDEDLGIFDAQDIAWIIFTDGGREDPVDWQRSIVTKTCEALGITTAISELADEVTVAELLDEYIGTTDE